MEPITLCGLAIVAFGLWIEFEPVTAKFARVLGSCYSVTGMTPPPAARRPHYVKYLDGDDALAIPACKASKSHLSA